MNANEILQITIVSHPSQNNSIAKNLNWILVNEAWVALSHSHLPPKFYKLAFLYEICK